MAQTHRGEMDSKAREIGRAGQPTMSAHDLLDDDHNRVLQLFSEYENSMDELSTAEKNRIARMICKELKVHTRIEEEIYYPRVRSRSDAEDVVNDALAEHEEAKALIREIESASTHDESFDEKVMELAEEIRHHISEERAQLFDIAEIAGCNTAEMARELMLRKQEIERALH